ncbi:MAG TPA: hypothetical protein VK528_11995 [Flavobacterium sp.]|nr:hypothetical protein [Flavobacterium sp.]
MKEKLTERIRESVEISVKGDRCIINTITLEKLGDNWHYGLIYSFGFACGADPYSEQLKFDTKNEALSAGLQVMIDEHTRMLPQAGDPLNNYKKKYMEDVIATANKMLENTTKSTQKTGMSL